MIFTVMKVPDSSFLSLAEHSELMEPLIEDIELIWFEKGGPPGISESIKLKIDEMKTGKFKGLLFVQNGEPEGFAWVERVTANYGNMVMHSLKKENIKPLVNGLIESGLPKGGVFEVVDFSDGDDYKDVFEASGLLRIDRMRMCRYLDQTFPYPTIPKQVTLEPLKAEHVEISSTISLAAHLESKDYIGYTDLTDYDRRLTLDKTVFVEKVYSDPITGATQLLRENGEAVGIITTVGIPCWGYDSVPWIFDVSLHPSHFGKGYGRLLMEQAIAALTEAEYPILGLAVSLNNVAAISLYEKLDFQEVEPFTEFAPPLP